MNQRNSPNSPPPDADALPTTGSPPKHLVYAHSLDEVVTAQTLRYVSTRDVSDTLSRLLDAFREVDETARPRPRRTPSALDRIEGRDFDLTLHRLQKDWQVRCQLHARGLHLQPQESWAAAEGMHRIIASTRLPGTAVDPRFNLHSYALHADFGPRWSLTDRNIKRLPTSPRHRIEKGTSGAVETLYMGKSRMLYDKVAEILKHPQKAYITALWLLNGWREGDAVTRFEVRPLKGERKASHHALDFDAEWRRAVYLSCPQPRGSKKRKTKGRIHPAWQPLLDLAFPPPWDDGAAPRIATPTPMPPDRLRKMKIGVAVDALAFLAADQRYDDAHIAAIVSDTPLAAYASLRPNMAEDLRLGALRHSATYGFADPWRR